MTPKNKLTLTRFCSMDEFEAYRRGETLHNTTDHWRGGEGGATTNGFCFTRDDPKTAWRYLKGIVSPECCIIVEPTTLRGLYVGEGSYADYSNGRDGKTCCIKREYCTAHYSAETMRLVKMLKPEEFMTDTELEVYGVFEQAHEARKANNWLQTPEGILHQLRGWQEADPGRAYAAVVIDDRAGAAGGRSGSSAPDIIGCFRRMFDICPTMKDFAQAAINDINNPKATKI